MIFEIMIRLKLFFWALIILASIFVYNYIKSNFHESSESNSIINDDKKHITIHSALYYNVSKLYSNSTMIILMNAHTEYLTHNITLQCFSQNQAANLTTLAQVRTGDSSGPYCLWRSYFVNCTTVDNPDYFGLKEVNSESMIEIEFEYPEENKYPVVMCYPQMFYESRWQQIIFVTEMYYYFGANLQVQYINSASTEIIDILEIYQKKGWVKVIPFGYVDFDRVDVEEIGYHPMHELNARNQATAYTECLMKYRESAEFIIIGDIDEILIPQKSTYFNEFSHWSKIFQNSAAFIYYRVDAKIKQAQDKFSLYDVINSLRVDNVTFVGKSVYQTKYAEMAWIHWPGFDNTTTVAIPFRNGSIYHIGLADQTKYKEILKHYKSVGALSNIQISEISKQFTFTFKSLPKLEINNIYAKIIQKCYDGDTNFQKPLRSNQTKVCLNPFQCKLPKTVENFKCIVARRTYNKNYLKNNIVLHVPSENSKLLKLNNGCNVFFN